MLRLAVSNIAWSSDNKLSIYKLLRDLGVSGVEVALSKIGPWKTLDDATVRAERDLITGHGLAVASYQALYFGVSGAQLLSDAPAFETLLAHTARVARWAEVMSGGGVGVFGAPRNRLRGNLCEREAFSLGVERFSRLAQVVADYGFVIALEPAPEVYGGDFLQTEAACAQMVRIVDHPALRLHLDTGCLDLTGEDSRSLITQHNDLIAHVHLSMPNLAPVVKSAAPIYKDILKDLEARHYRGWFVIEMRETDDPAASIIQAVHAVQAARH